MNFYTLVRVVHLDQWDLYQLYNIKEVHFRQNCQKWNQGIRKTTSQISDQSFEEVSTKKELSKVASVSHDTIAKVKKIQEKAPEEVKPI